MLLSCYGMSLDLLDGGQDAERDEQSGEWDGVTYGGDGFDQRQEFLEMEEYIW